MNEVNATQAVAATPRTWKPVYTVVERTEGKRFWIRIGTCFINRDQSMTVKLDASPINGELVIRDPDPAFAPARRAGGAGGELLTPPENLS
ncbi:MAG TPA: hypothetical protein VFF06_25020 [Polyangia bacterium]|nr:hypothetical protein [Polyangia bacterium]